MVSAKRIESFDFVKMYRVFKKWFQLKEFSLSILRRLYRGFNNGFSYKI